MPSNTSFKAIASLTNQGLKRVCFRLAFNSRIEKYSWPLHKVRAKLQSALQIHGFNTSLPIRGFTTIYNLEVGGCSFAYIYTFTTICLLLWKFSVFVYKIRCSIFSWESFPGGLVVKNLPASAADAGHVGSVSGSGRSPGEGNGNLLQYSCLGNPMDRGAWRATVH